MNNRRYSGRQESRVAKALSGRKTSNSGATVFDKGDVDARELLIECKTLKTPQLSHSIKREWLTKCAEEAMARGKHFSTVCFDFGDGRDYFILSERDFVELYECWIRSVDGGE